MNPSPASRRIRIALAREEDRPAIYRLRHAVFARELAQHPENAAGVLTDHLDASNLYITASQGAELLGFISITPPDRDGGSGKYSIDRYFPREEIPFPVDGRLYEVRLLAVAQPHRGQQTAGLLMYAAYRWVESRGGARLAAMGRLEILEMYRKAGLEPHGRRACSGACTFELLSATISRLREHLTRYRPALDKLKSEVDWQLGIPFREASAGPPACYHGGASFSAVGDEFDRLERAQEIINADVLDAWFPPSPQVIAALREHLPWLLRTSPPAGCEGMARAIARARGVSPACILPGAGSSDLIFLALRSWLDERSRTLILDPMYGEYAFLLDQVIGCRVDRLPLSRKEGYRLEVPRLEARFGGAYDLIILVNPNSPTGAHVPREVLEPVLARAPQDTRIWIDETYVDYAGPDQSIERFAAQSGNILVCKSMSKAYALSGARAAYLCGPPRWIEELKPLNPPWAVSLPGQVAAVRALQDPRYYEERWRETRALRERLARELAKKTGLEVLPGAAIHCRHRYSTDIDCVSPHLNERFEQVLEKLSQWQGWTTNREQKPVLILGERHQVELGIRQLRRAVPLQTTLVNGLRVPTVKEALRIKAYLCLERKAVRDYIDVAALIDHLGLVESLNALKYLNLVYESRIHQTPVTRFAETCETDPLDLKMVNLKDYKGIRPPYDDWKQVQDTCQHVSRQLLKEELKDRLPHALDVGFFDR